MIKEWLSKFTPPPKKQRVEIVHLRHQIKNDIQAIRSGNTLLKSMSGVIDLNRRSPRT